ncbi:uncharacterized protein LOC143024443 [Oratosquilla oratoria]|uniref:uncharacterized protein LOC143024443 n=1 Tax=Oratosquilla oratoria TaxID=337810 RepID=UPI003F76604F
MDEPDYTRKMEELLSDTCTYNKQHDGTAKKEAEYFNKSTRSILKRTEKGKKLLHLLEEDPKVPSMKGLPKIHKPEIPLRPITSGIRSAPHKSKTTVICPWRHQRNKRITKNHLLGQLPVCKRDYMQLIEKCIGFRSFRFKDQEYHLLDGLPMGSPLSAVAASLYLEMLERDHYRKIIPKDAHWFRYVDDCLLVFPAENDTSDIMYKLNEVVNNIQFTMENESLGHLPFLDTEIHRQGNKVLFKVYRKPTNKDDLIHFYSAHNERTKHREQTLYFGLTSWDEMLCQYEMNGGLFSFPLLGQCSITKRTQYLGPVPAQQTLR